MADNTVIKVENVSKQYRLGEIGTNTLQHDFKRWYASILGKENPFLKIGEENDRTTKGNSDYVWALKDINFQIDKGDAVGIIGKNGAGKSTLLKLLSRVTSPTTGVIKYKGKIASLLEVGTGFHPDMTGRENIYLNGAILGMRRSEITRKFDEIVDFSGVERYIDTPVKRYSSGMYVRLAFAVAAHLESEILIVDEVLAVGDSEFQKKCLGKMGDVRKGEGRTVLFVSHNIAAVKQLCDKGILMHKGTVLDQGFIQPILEEYVYLDSKSSDFFTYQENLNLIAQIYEVKLINQKGLLTNNFMHEEDINFEIKINCRVYEKNIRVNISVLDIYDNVVFINRFNLTKGINEFKGLLKGNVLISGAYKLLVAIDIPNVKLIEIIVGGLRFDIVDIGNELALKGDTENGIITSPLIWL